MQPSKSHDIFRIIARYEEYIEIKILKKIVKSLLV